MKSYLLMYRDGFRIVKKHIWIFLILFLVGTFNIICHTSLIWHFTVRHQEIISSFMEGWRLFFPHTFFMRLPHLILSSFQYFQPYISYGGTLSIILSLTVLIGYRYIKRYLCHRKAEPELKTPVLFIEEILSASVIIGIGLLLANLSIRVPIIRSSMVRGSMIFLQAAIFSIPMATYWYRAVLLTLLTGGILIVINRDLTNKRIIKSEVTSEMIKCFKPLFLFYLILNGIFWVLSIPRDLALITQIKETYPHSSHTMTRFLIPLITLAVIFVPYIVVKEKLALKAAFKANFIFWKKHFVKIIIFIFFGVTILFIPLLAGLLLRLSPSLILSLLAGIVTITLKVFANLIVVAALVIFYSSPTFKKDWDHY